MMRDGSAQNVQGVIWRNADSNWPCDTGDG